MYSLILIDKTVHIYLATLLLKLLLRLTRFYVACSQTIYFLSKVCWTRVIKYKPLGIYNDRQRKGVVVGEVENILQMRRW